MKITKKQLRKLIESAVATFAAEEKECIEEQLDFDAFPSNTKRELDAATRKFKEAKMELRRAMSNFVSEYMSHIREDDDEFTLSDIIEIVEEVFEHQRIVLSDIGEEVAKEVFYDLK